MAPQREPRTDDAAVEDAINLIKSIPTIGRPDSGVVKRQLTPKQFEEVLTAIQDPNDRRLPGGIKKWLRYDYTNHKQQFEIRIRTVLHSHVSCLFAESVADWRRTLKNSRDDGISNAARSSSRSPGLTIELKETKECVTPDWSMEHTCRRKPPCDYPSLVLEIAWTETREELRQKANTYIQHSNGDIRTVVAVYMHEMWKAEQKNERRLQQMYVRGEVDDNGSYSYSEDANNITGSASILVWRAENQNGIVRAGNMEEKMFRDEDGNYIPSASLQLQLQDVVCKDIAESLERQKGLKATPLEISSEYLGAHIHHGLKLYRQERQGEMKSVVEKKVKRKREEEQENEERPRKANEVTTHEDRNLPSEDNGV
ncbi:hypothetical protein O1611_g7201 [Lasiodiplodia mahajangana]|uniref:Uncharacterized protein n=1 Tax=Lasiodiplodia mahajangana TaxID=1108764 RepID=A0ACC2JG36_9PEZI|nr:hypothetical protein O1611_g7201 [Lasiodiplodia mahajangana]